MYHKLILIFILVFSLYSCSKDKGLEYEINENKVDPYKLYQEGFDAFERGEYYYAEKKFSEAELNFEIIEFAAKSAIMSSYALYGINFYAEALENLERYIRKYPADKNIMYAHYLIAIIYYEQMSDENVALLEHEMQENIEAAISNHRYALNLETNWEGNETIKPILVKFIEARIELQLVPKVYDHGWRYILEDEGRPGFGIEPKDFRYRNNQRI